MMEKTIKLAVAITALLIAFAVAATSVILVWDRGGNLFKPWAESSNKQPANAFLNREWQLKDLYADEKAWEKDFAKLKLEATAFEGHQDHLKDSAKELRGALDQKDILDKIYDRLYAYAMLRRDGNFADAAAKTMWAGISSYTSEKGQKTAYFYPELYAMNKSRLKALALDPLLAPYKSRLLDIVEDDYMPDEKVEYIKSLSGSLMGLPEKFYQSYMYEYGDDSENSLSLEGDRTSQDRNRRKKAFDQSDEKLEKGMPMLSAAMAAKVETNKFQAKSQGDSDITTSFLYGDGLDRETYDVLMNVAKEDKDLLQRYLAYRKKALKISDQLRYYDGDMKTAPPYGTVSYEKAVSMTQSVVSTFGKTYSAIFKKAIDDHWVDVYPRDDKYTGSYTYSAYTGHPYMLLNYDNDLASAATLAHETGHVVNQYLTNQSRSYQEAQIPMVNAEIASTVNEILFYDKALKEAENSNEKRAVLEAYLDNLNSGFFYQAALAEFQDTIHRDAMAGVTLEADYFNKTFGDILGDYYGPNYKIETYDRVGWAQVDHLYWDFYVYKYVLCTAAAMDVAQRMEAGDQALIQRYMSFLQAGDTRSVEAMMNDLGVDLRSSSYTKSFRSRYTALLDELETLNTKK